MKSFCTILVCSYFDPTSFKYLLLTVSNLLSCSCSFGLGICFQSLQLNFGFLLYSSGVSAPKGYSGQLVSPRLIPFTGLTHPHHPDPPNPAVDRRNAQCCYKGSSCYVKVVDCGQGSCILMLSGARLAT